MRYVLDCVYLLLLAIVWPKLVWNAWRHGKYRDGWGARLLGRVPVRTDRRRCVWLHALNVGEVQLLKPLLTELERTLPDWDFVISTTTRAAFDLARAKYAPRCVFYRPLDFSWAVRRAFRAIRPDLLVLAELELWPNLIGEARRQGVRVAVVNGRLSERSRRRYGRIRAFIGRVLQKIDLLAVQDGRSAERLLELGAAPESVRVAGAIRLDGAGVERESGGVRFSSPVGGRTGETVFLASGTEAADERMALEAYLTLADEHPGLRLILAPADPERAEETAELLRRSGVDWSRSSRPAPERGSTTPRVLLVDTVGDAGAWRVECRLALAGGGLEPIGGRSVIEAAASGAALAVGPDSTAYRDVVELLEDYDASTEVRDAGQLTAWLRRCLSDPAYAQEQGRRAQAAVRQQAGAVRRTCDWLRPLLDDVLARDGGRRPRKSAA